MNDLLTQQQSITAASPVPESVTDRTQGIGGSDAAAILGMSNYSTPLDIYNRAIGETADEVNSYPAKRGTALEPILREAYVELTGNVVTEPPAQRHPHCPWMVAHLDGRVDEERILEIKTAGLWVAQSWGEAGTDDLPESYLLQVQHYLSVTGARVADVFAEIAGRDLQLFHVDRDEELIEMVEDAERKFWFDHVLERRPPEPSTAEEVKRVWPQSKAKSLTADASTTELIRMLADAKAKEKKLEKVTDSLKLQIQQSMVDCDTILGANGKPLVTWKTGKQKTYFDIGAFRAAQPEMHESFCEDRPGNRTFLVKPAASKL